MLKLIQTIRDMYPSLSNAKKTAASYFLNHFESLQFATVLELSSLTGVSDTTIIHLCADLGFSGFSAFKREVRRELQQNPSISSISQTDGTGGDDEIARLTNTMVQEVITTCGYPQNIAAMRRAVGLMKQADCIYAIGFWSFAARVQEFCLQLRRSGWKAQAIFPDMGDYIDKVLQIESSDVVLLYDFSLYISALTDICVILKQKNVPLILITDAGPCPRLAYADVTICCNPEDSLARPDAGGHSDLAAGAVNHLLRSLLQKGPQNQEYETLRDGLFSRFNPYGTVDPVNQTHI